MASPQTEDGYTRIANEIMEALTRTRIPGEARQCLDFIIRKTYGYGKKEDAISLSQFAGATGLKRPTICKAIGKLTSLNMITKKGNAKITTYKFNKDFDAWTPLPKKVTLPKKIMSITKKGNPVLPKKGHTIETPTKDNITKDTSEIDFGLAQLLKSRLKENHPKGKLPKNLNAWANDCRLMRERDNRTPDEIRAMIEFSQADSFWKANIRSMSKLRDQFDQLWLKANSNGSGAKRSASPPNPPAQQVIAERRGMK